VRAQDRADALVTRPKPNKLFTCPRLHGAVNVGLAKDGIQINGRRVASLATSVRPQLVSVTRSSGTTARAFEHELMARGFRLKTGSSQLRV
jgi:hypothetical protein